MNAPSEKKTAIAGRKPVLEALAEAGLTVETVYVRNGLKGSFAAQIRQACKSGHVPIKFVPQERLDRLAGEAVHQGVVALTSDVEILDLEGMLSQIAGSWDETARIKPLLLIPDRIYDPHNLGAIVRSAAAFGCNGIILPARQSAPLGPATIKSSAGTALDMLFARVNSLTQSIRQLKERGYWIAGLAGDGSTSLDEVDWDRPIVLVVGNEAEGISKRVRDECDLLVSIPISPRVESLNAAVATGIVLRAAARAKIEERADSGQRFPRP